MYMRTHERLQYQISYTLIIAVFISNIQKLKGKNKVYTSKHEYMWFIIFFPF